MGRSKEQLKAWRKANPEKIKEYGRHAYAKRDKERGRIVAKAWRVANPNKVSATNRKNAFKRRYGITPAQYDLLFILQGGMCAICLSPPGIGSRRCLVIDHNHITGVLRGLLCQLCNTVLGNSHENTKTLGAAIAYLEGH